MNHKRTSNSQAGGEQLASKVLTNNLVDHGSVGPPPPQYQQIKLALDVHAAGIVVVRRAGSEQLTDYCLPRTGFSAVVVLAVFSIPRHDTWPAAPVCSFCAIQARVIVVSCRGRFATRTFSGSPLRRRFSSSRA
jgi:hypothetical protein